MTLLTKEDIQARQVAWESTEAWVKIEARGYALSVWLNQFLESTRIRGAEIGVFAGRLSSYLLRTHPNLFLYMVDKWEPYDSGSSASLSGDNLMDLPDHLWTFAYAYAKGRTSNVASRREIIRKDSVEAAGDIEDESLDFVFIDADHSFEGASRDLKAWIPKVKPGGLVTGHDFDAKDYPGWGVREALEIHGPKKILTSLNGVWGFPKAWLL